MIQPTLAQTKQPKGNCPGVTGLVVTLGPACVGHEAQLARAGATEFRINSSHMSVDGVRQYIQAARTLAPETDIVVDLQGAKMRLGDFPERAVAAGEHFSLVNADTPSHAQLPLPHPEAFSSLRAGDRVSIDDGRVNCAVLEVAADRMICQTLNAGVLRPRKGFNRAEHPIRLYDIAERDLTIARAAIEAGCSTFALSFVADGTECHSLRRHLGSVKVIAKIERRDALSQWEPISAHADCLWICRGDLGAQLGLLALGSAVAAVEPRRARVPVWMAGQVLEHLTAHRQATRSEICHVYDLLTRGYSGIVLSDETAIGVDPVNAVKVARSLLDAATGECRPLAARLPAT